MLGKEALVTTEGISFGGNLIPMVYKVIPGVFEIIMVAIMANIHTAFWIGAFNGNSLPGMATIFSGRSGVHLYGTIAHWTGV